MKPVMTLKRETILEIRDLARHLRDPYAKMPKPLDGGMIGQRMKEYFSDPIRIQLETMVGDLPKDERAELAALVDLGTLGKRVKDWGRLLQNAKQTDGEGAARNLVGRSALAYLIDQGMVKIQATKYYESEPASVPIESKTKLFRLMLRMMKAILPQLNEECPVLGSSWALF